MRLENRLSNFDIVISNNTRNNVIFGLNGHRYIKISTPNGLARLVLNINNKNKTIDYLVGSTNKNARGKGHGTFLRAVPILAAKNTGYKKITHTGSFKNKNQRNVYKNPPSMRIIKFLGFKRKTPNGFYSELDLNNVNINRIKRIIKGNYTKNEFNKIVGKK